MAWTQADAGSEVMNGSEDDLSTQTAEGTYLLYLDLNSMAAGDRILLRIYVKANSGGTERLLYPALPGGAFEDAQESPAVVSVPVSIILNGSARFTLHQTNGTLRTIPWVLLVNN